MPTKHEQYLARAEQALLAGDDKRAALYLRFAKAFKHQKGEAPSLVLSRPKNKPPV